MVENRSIYNNIYVLLKLRPRGVFFLLLNCCLFIYFIYLLFYQKIVFYEEYQALYECNETCQIVFYQPLTKEKSLTNMENFYVNNEKLIIKDITFGTTINVPNTVSLLKEIRLEIAPPNLSSKQTVLLKREIKDKTFIELLLNAMKGGD